MEHRRLVGRGPRARGVAAGVKVFFDGGCGPHGMELAVVAGGRTQMERDLGPGTSMVAEWLALIRATELARDLDLSDPVLLGDALAVIAQANGTARCPAPLAPHLDAFRLIQAQLGGCRLRYIKRGQNLAGIALSRARDGRSNVQRPAT